MFGMLIHFVLQMYIADIPSNISGNYNRLCEIQDNRAHVSLSVIDEIQFFNSKIIGVIEHLQKNDINVIAAGLNTDFRGLPFGSMGHLLAMSDEAFALAGVCDVEGCNRPGSRTQRLINNEPAHFDSPALACVGRASTTAVTFSTFSR